MASVWDKIDSGLALIYANYLDVRRHGSQMVRPDPIVARGDKLHVLVRYKGDLTAVESAGFETAATDGAGQASGYLRLETLENVAARDEVLTIRYGSEPTLHLDVSIPQINAHQLWTVGPSPLFNFTGQTGAGVIIGILDTGVDITHPYLWARATPDISTRILRIWDPGLVAIAGEAAPAKALLDPLMPLAAGYGVEYTQAKINDVLNKRAAAASIRHKDCSGHGTHVASTAAGDGRFKFKHIGVAPRAELIIVKMLYWASSPPVNFDQVFKDAVHYIRKAAAVDRPGSPVVINYSAGRSMGPHDGLEDDEDWLSNEFKDASSAGKIFVAAAGNEAGALFFPPKAAKRSHARIKFTAAGSVEIPLEVFDKRPSTDEWGTCVAVPNIRTHLIDFYYPAGATGLTVELKVPGAAAFSAAPAPFSGRTCTITGSLDPGMFGGAPINRRKHQVRIVPHAASGHLVGDYAVKLTATGALEIQMWCLQHRGQGIRIKDPPPALPLEVTVEDRFLINSPGAAANVITVGAYNAEDQPTLPTAPFSSRGPIARYGVGGAAPAKPDIAGPGVTVHAAKSADTKPSPPGGVNFISMNGTSMATPHVTGVVALMLQKNKTLTPSQVRTILQTHANKVPAPVPEEVGGGRIDAKAAVDNTPP